MIDDASNAVRVQDIKVFGPVATLCGYEVAAGDPHFEESQAVELARRGQRSLVASVYSDDDVRLARISLELADTHGRVNAISPSVAQTQTGHDNVMPMSLHGGPGRAGDGEELGGLRALNFNHCRAAVRGLAPSMNALTASTGKVEI